MRGGCDDGSGPDGGGGARLGVRRGSAWLLTLGCALSALSMVACGGAATPAAEVPVAEAPRPRNAAALAQEIAGGKVSVLVYAERARGHALAAQLARMNLWGPLLDGTGIDPEKNLLRAFVTAPSLRAEREAVIVLEHDLTPEKLQAGLDTLKGRSNPPAVELEGLGVPATQVTIQGHTRVVAVVEPSFLVVLPESKAKLAKRFVGTGGFPDPEGPEAAVATALEPAKTLRMQYVPRVPETVRSLSLDVVLDKSGAVDLLFDGPSESPEQARSDAAELTEGVDRATSYKVAILKIRLFDPIVFTAEADRVKAKRRLTPKEIDQLFGLLSALTPR
ncbi:Hypothetical protein CAP_0402 [Chondromyces apiculatus DSM 436]|uniref:Uncharacterized protein n=1 Tax=Chondromyces apiculatus DSM 436 TaxID=1192034 RepID=A0A017SUL3_9BACT|nr:Hypothetical protein CAP_0402 [Chondromyces apiculatus DSM 436]